MLFIFKIHNKLVETSRVFLKLYQTLVLIQFFDVLFGKNCFFYKKLTISKVKFNFLPALVGTLIEDVVAIVDVVDDVVVLVVVTVVVVGVQISTKSNPK